MAEPPIMVRAEISEQEWKDLRKLAIELEAPVQRIVGDLISDYLRANGYEYPAEEAIA